MKEQCFFVREVKRGRGVADLIKFIFVYVGWTVSKINIHSYIKIGKFNTHLTAKHLLMQRTHWNFFLGELSPIAIRLPAVLVVSIVLLHAEYRTPVA